MAIKLKQILANGIVVSYHNIQRLMWIKGSVCKVAIGSYISKEDRDKGRRPIEVRMVDVKGTSLAECYAYLKANQLKGGPDGYAEDC
jgi:hypothetical protein